MIHPRALWFTGLSGSGKSTLASAVNESLKKDGQTLKLFDGDELRKGLNQDLGFSLDDRFENIRRVAEVNKLFLNFGISTINAFISPTSEIRAMAKKIIGEDRFVEICLTTPLKDCVERDPKGLYRKIKEGQLRDFTGFDSVFERSESAALYLDTSQTSLKVCIQLILNVFDQPSNNDINFIPKS